MRAMREQLKRVPAVWVVANGALWARNRLHLLASGGSGRGSVGPRLSNPVCQLATAAQCIEPVYVEWCVRTQNLATFHRKKWEFAYILQCLRRTGMMAPGRRGLGFGCGREPIPAVLVRAGCEIVATDLAADVAGVRGWVDSLQHAAGLEALKKPTICADAVFSRRVFFRSVDMNAIPEEMTGFDFLWSSCALEHLGSLEHGLAFIRNAMRCLRPGGIAVHTTEFNLCSDDATFESPGLSLYRKSDLLRLAAELVAAGHKVAPFNWDAGSAALDAYVDLPPYSETTHLKLEVQKFACTSIGLLIRKGEPRDADET